HTARVEYHAWESFAEGARAWQESQDLEIQPDERDHQTERAVPLQVLGGTALHAGLDEVEVEDQVQRGDDDDDAAHHDARSAVPLEERHGDAEEREHEPDHIVKSDRPCR